MALPKLFKETNVFKKNAIVNGITDAAKRATSYVTDLSNGIFVHPENDNQNGVQITNIIEIIKSGIAALQIDSTALQINTLVDNVLTETARFSGYALYLAGRKIRLLFESNVGSLTVYGNNGTGSRLNLKAVRLGSSGLEASEANVNIDIDSSGTAKTSFDSDVYMSENLQVGGNLDVQNITALDISNDETSSVDIEFSNTITDSAGTPISVWSEVEDYLSQDLGTMASDISACLKKTDGVITNFNDETATGFHTYTSSTTNRPPANAGGFAIVLHISSTSVWQLAFITSTSSTAMQAYARRMYSSGNWTSWRAFTFAS